VSGFAEIARRNVHDIWHGSRNAVGVRVGSELKAARKKAGITIEVISKRTKISVSKLVALEKNDFKNLPTGLYLFSAVRAYAREVRIDPEPMVEQLRVAFADKDALDALQALDAAGALDTKKPADPRTSRGDRSNLLRATIATGAVFIAAGAVTAAYLHNKRGGETPLVSLSPSTPALASVPAIALPTREDVPQQTSSAAPQAEPTKIQKSKPRPASAAAGRRETVASDPTQQIDLPSPAAAEEPAESTAIVEELSREAPAASTAP
jgi:cytoskeleton protein RodZ